MLHIKEGKSTSLHCHVKKRTSLIVIEGNVVCSTLEDRFRLSALDAVVLEAGAFHGTLATSVGGAFVLEVETPVMKHDLVRLKDSFGRQGAGYETVAHHSRDFTSYEYKPFASHAGAMPVNFQKMQFSLLDEKSAGSNLAQFSKPGIVVPTKKPFMQRKSALAQVAEAISTTQAISGVTIGLSAGVELLLIQTATNK